MRASAWVPLVAMWLILAVVLAFQRQFLPAWSALGCSGLALLSAIIDFHGRREVEALRAISRIQAAQLRNHEKGTNVDP